MVQSEPAGIDAVATLNAIAWGLLGLVAVIAGYIWNRTVGQMEAQHRSAMEAIDKVQKAAVDAVNEFRTQNRQEHQAFEERFRAVETGLAYLKGKEDGEKS